MVLLCCERLFVPAFVKTDIDRNIADQFIFGKENIFRIGDMRKNRLVLFEFYRDPGSGSFICRCTGSRMVKPSSVETKMDSTSLMLEPSRNWIALRMLS